MAVAGVGVDHNTLTELVNKMPVSEGQKPAIMQKATFHSGTQILTVITFFQLHDVVLDASFSQFSASFCDKLISVIVQSNVIFYLGFTF